MSLLDEYRRDLRAGVPRDVARHKVRSALIRRRRSAWTVARHADRISEILDRVDREVEDEMDDDHPSPAA